MNEPKTLCLPLMSLDEEKNQLPCCFATATFAYVGDSFFLVSAAHSILEMNGQPVYIALDPVSISWQITLS